jgi:Fasciclin domain
MMVGNKPGRMIAVALLAAAFAATALPQASAQSSLGSIRGVGFLDANRNGKRDPGERNAFGLYKVSNGGNFFRCGNVGRDQTFGLTVTPGNYWVMPIAPAGFSTTTPIIPARVERAGSVTRVEMGFAQDPLASVDICSGYDPKRVIRPGGALGIVETAGAAGEFHTLLTALRTAGLLDTVLTGGPFTVFAPTDLAFGNFTDEEITALLADRPRLREILLAHVVPGTIGANDVVNGAELKTLQGKVLAVTTEGDDVFIGGARLKASDIRAANGVIHVIDSVIVP